jgi:polar amino acid transport system substrate-binding protein
VSVFAESISSKSEEMINHDNLSITIKFSDGSIGTLIYFANGDKKLPKEYCEAHSERSSAIMDNFTSLRLFRAEKEKELKFDGKKGINEEVAETLKSIRVGKPMPITFNEIKAVTAVTFAALEALATGEKIYLNNK